MRIQGDFSISTLDKIRVQRLLREQNQLLRSAAGREMLMYEIAPLICRDEDQQDLFYQIYKKYLHDDLKQTEQEKEIKKQNLKIEEALSETQQSQRKWWFAQLGLLLLTILWWLFVHQFNKPRIFFSGATEEAVLGTELILVNDSDTLFQRYTTFGKEVPLNYHWVILDENGDTLHQATPFHLKWQIPDSLLSSHLAIHLHGIHSHSGSYLNSHKKQLRLLCNTLQVGSISIKEGDTHLYQDSLLTFLVETDPEDHKHLIYHWDFGNLRDTTFIAQYQHQYDKEGRYRVSVRVKDTLNTFGFCEPTARTVIEINDNTKTDTTIALYRFPLEEIPPISSFQLYNWVYALWLGLLGLTGWLWWKWRNRFDPNKEIAKAKLLDLEKRFNAPDKSPYSIVFENGKEKIRTTADQYEIAASLRRRQEGFRKEIDIDTTVNATVQRAGYLDLKFKSNTRLTHYLVLIDWQNAESHQARLFQYLAEMLQQEEVLFEIFFYQEDFNRIWNKQFSKGISLNQLQQLCADYKLLIFGDAHAFVQQAPKDKIIHPDWSRLFRKWTDRLLITPKPIISWTYVEARLYCLFPIFPGDLNGILQAVEFMGDGKTEEDLPNTLEEWEAKLSKSQIEENVNRRWFDLEHHEAYLQDHPEVLRWLKALVVYPEPTWNITLAIGHALGVPITYDNLMLLARVPWLQKGEFSMDLWEEIWDELSKEDELTARAAVKTELKAVQAETVKGFANQALEQDLAIQEFILQPKEKENKAAIQYLNENNLLPEIHQEELDLAIDRHTNFEKRGDKIGETLGYYLEETKEAEKRVPRPFYTRTFWATLMAALLSLLTILGTFFAPQTWPIFEKIETLPNEAAQLNNLAVRVQEQGTTISETYLSNLAFPADTLDNYIFSPAALLLKNAIQLDSNLILAQRNLLKVLHNEGVAYYARFKNSTNLSLAKPPFNAAIQQPTLFKLDSIRHAAMYGLATVHHFLKEENEVCALLDTLRSVPNLVHFQTIPNLDSKAIYCQLVTKNDTAIVKSPDDFVIDSLLERIKAQNIEGICRKITNVNVSLSLRKTRLSQSQLNQINQNANSSANTNLIIRIPHDREVQLLDSIDNYYVVRYRRQTGWVVKLNKGKNTLQSCKREITISPQLTIFCDKRQVYLNQNQQAIVWAYDFNCKTNKKIRALRFPSLGIGQKNPPTDTSLTWTFGCRNIGIMQGDYWVGDNEGNWDYTRVQLEILDTLGVCQSKINKLDSLELALKIPIPETILIQGDTFTMGCTPEQAEFCSDNEKPTHTVKVETFYMGKYEVTNEEFVAFLNEKGNQEEGGTQWVNLSGGISGIEQVKDKFRVKKGLEKHPMIYVSWFGAKAYCQWLKEKTGQDWRLPSEAEWEFAARGGRESQQYIYAGSNTIDQVVWYRKNSFDLGENHPDYGPHPVGQKTPNELGIYDMSGNVYEWTEDCWHENYVNAPSTGIPWLAADKGDCSIRVLRGGSWNDYDRLCRISLRLRIDSDYRNNSIGFRLSRY